MWPSDEHRDRIPARPRSLRHGSVANPAQPVLGFRPPNLSGSFRIGNRRQRSCCCELLCYFFLNLSKTDISENLRVPLQIFRAAARCWLLACSARPFQLSRQIEARAALVRDRSHLPTLAGRADALARRGI